jgi:hypothetical protein
MPIKKKIQPKITVTVYSRKKMTSNQAKTQKITKEMFVICRKSVKDGLTYIKNCGDIKKVYIIRDQKHKMIKSYSYRNNAWHPINKGGYYGGYKIGNPLPVCSCGVGHCNDPDHPTCG